MNILLTLLYLAFVVWLIVALTRAKIGSGVITSGIAMLLLVEYTLVIVGHNFPFNWITPVLLLASLAGALTIAVVIKCFVRRMWIDLVLVFFLDILHLVIFIFASINTMGNMH
ncbi:MAG: hypothetical protein HYS18_14490 [Burkholderiales bacterium]|nr:hypothetical protein [Burkholderiales bacterium]